VPLEESGAAFLGLFGTIEVQFRSYTLPFLRLFILQCPFLCWLQVVESAAGFRTMTEAAGIH